MREDIAQRRALHCEPLAAARLIKLGPERYLWYVRAHHILVDGFGMALIEHRCAALYAHYLGEGSAGMPLGAFDAFQQAELAYAGSDRCERDRRFWQSYLPPSQALPTVRKGGEAYGVRRLSTHHRLPAAVSQRLAQLAERSGINWPDLLVALSAAVSGDAPRHPAGRGVADVDAGDESPRAGRHQRAFVGGQHAAAAGVTAASGDAGAFSPL